MGHLLLVHLLILASVLVIWMGIYLLWTWRRKKYSGVLKLIIKLSIVLMELVLKVMGMVLVRLLLVVEMDLLCFGIPDRKKACLLCSLSARMLNQIAGLLALAMLIIPKKE